MLTFGLTVGALFVVVVMLGSASLLGWLPWPTSEDHSGKAPQNLSPTPSWRIDHAAGDIFELTNIGRGVALNVDIVATNLSETIKGRGAPWSEVFPGTSVRFRRVPDGHSADVVSITWRTMAGDADAVELWLPNVIDLTDPVATGGTDQLILHV